MSNHANLPGATKSQVVVASKRKESKQSPWPYNHDPMELEVSKEIGYDVRRRGLSESWKIVRFLYSKAVYEPTEITLQESFVLDSVLERLLTSKDASWNLKYRKTLLFVSNNFGLWENTRKGSQSAARGLKLLLNTFEWGFLLSSHAYYGRKESHKIQRWIIRRNRQLKSIPPPQAYIGVGYRDHGTCSIPSYDASPAWQEVASALARDHDEFNPDQLKWYEVVYSRFERKLVPIKSYPG